MKGNGNSLSTLFRKLYFYCLPTSGMRTKYICKHKNIFYSLGENIFWQTRKFPADPEYISIGNNVRFASGVEFINHDGISYMFNSAGYRSEKFKPYVGCIEVGDNVVGGANVLILADVKIGSNVVIAAGAVVSKDVDDYTVVGGIPARPIGKLENLVEKRMNLVISKDTPLEEIWAYFHNTHK